MENTDLWQMVKKWNNNTGDKINKREEKILEEYNIALSDFNTALTQNLETKPLTDILDPWT